ILGWIPKERATSQAFWPSSVTILTADILNSLSNRFFFPFSPTIGHPLPSWLLPYHQLFIVSTFSGEDHFEFETRFFPCYLVLEFGFLLLCAGILTGIAAR